MELYTTIFVAASVYQLSQLSSYEDRSFHMEAEETVVEGGVVGGSASPISEEGL